MTYLFLAYSIVWVGLLAYVLAMGGQNRRLDNRLAALEQTLGRSTEDGGARSVGTAVVPPSQRPN